MKTNLLGYENKITLTVGVNSSGEILRYYNKTIVILLLCGVGFINNN